MKNTKTKKRMPRKVWASDRDIAAIVRYLVGRISAAQLASALKMDKARALKAASVLRDMVRDGKAFITRMNRELDEQEVSLMKYLKHIQGMKLRVRERAVEIDRVAHVLGLDRYEI